MPLHLSSVNGQYGDVTFEPQYESQSENYDILEKQLQLDTKKRAYVLNDDGINVPLVPSCTATKFIVLERTDQEMEVANDKWVEGEAGDERRTALEQQLKSSRERNAAVNRYMKNITHDENLLFPDYNKVFRDAFTNGLRGQTPKAFLQQSNDTEKIGSLSHEPTVGEVENFKTSQLRWAFTLGLQHSDKNPEHFMPSAEELREAHRQGKEAVAIRLNDAEFAHVDLEFFKMCALPTKYADYQGGKEKKEVDNFAKRMALRTSFQAGVTDAWHARKANCVTQVRSKDRVSEKPSLRDAFGMGVVIAKRLTGVPGATLEVTNEGKVHITGEFDKSHQNEVNAFTKGLNAAWEAQQNGSTPPRPDVEYPDNTDEEKKAFKMGLAKKKELDKEREERERAEEAAAEKNKPEPTMVDKFCKQPLQDFKETCCPVFSEDPATGATLCCGTSMSDWALILLLFAIYYTYLAMWYWAHIEIMFVIAEPQRPH